MSDEQKRCPYIETVNDLKIVCGKPIWDAEHCDAHQEKIDQVENDLIVCLALHEERDKEIS